MKKYSFLIEAFPSNYWKNTYANFEYIDSSDNVMDLINKAKKEKYTPDFKSESNSYYLISPNKRYLIRSYVTGLMIFLVVIAWIIGYYSIPSISRYSINNNNGDASNQTINIKDGE